MTKPDPTIVSKRRSGLALLIFMAWMDTTAGETRSNRTGSGSAQGSAAWTAIGASVKSATSRSHTRVMSVANDTLRARMPAAVPSAPSSRAYVVVWLVLVFAWTTNFTIRIAFAALLPFVMRDLALSYTRAGVLAAAFFYAYGVCQLPAG